MKARLLFVGLIASLTAFVGITAAAVAGPNGSENAAMCVLNTQLRAENEPNGASTSLASGHAQVKVLNDGTLEFKTFILNPNEGERFNRAHIHLAPAGSNGPIHVDFLEGGVPVAELTGRTITFTGVARPRAAFAGGAALCAAPEMYYVNVHSNLFAGGAIRGQLG
jgi:CHRD domain